MKPIDSVVVPPSKLFKDELLHTLSANEHSKLKAKGYVVIRGVFDKAEVDQLRSAADLLYKRQDLIHPNNLRFTFARNVQTEQDVVVKVDRISDIDDCF